MDARAVRAKFDELVVPAYGAARASEIAAAIDGVEAMPDVAALGALLAAPA